DAVSQRFPTLLTLRKKLVDHLNAIRQDNELQLAYNRTPSSLLMSNGISSMNVATSNIPLSFQ
ncbi:unnamed protein product, partial [Didymodactylos carnosus]